MLRRPPRSTLFPYTPLFHPQINLQAGGPPFFPALPQSVRDGYRQGKWMLTKEEPATWRRSVYSYWKRGMRYPMFEDRKSTRLNSSHSQISYAVFCLNKKIEPDSSRTICFSLSSSSTATSSRRTNTSTPQNPPLPPPSPMTRTLLQPPRLTSSITSSH